MNIFDHYTDGEPIGMAHPLLMSRMQAAFDAGLAAAQGVPLRDALVAIRARMQSLFGDDIPLALVDATVSMVYAHHQAAQSPSEPVQADAVRRPDPAPVVRPYRYSKGMVAVSCASVDGLKTRAARLAEHVGGRWVCRARGYVMSPRKAERLLALFAEGRDACSFTRELLP